jgi:hypothetical protein
MRVTGETLHRTIEQAGSLRINRCWDLVPALWDPIGTRPVSGQKLDSAISLIKYSPLDLQLGCGNCHFS